MSLPALDNALSPQQVRVAELAAAGCTPTQIASATGFSVGYISQLSSMDAYKEMIVAKSSDRLERDIKAQDRYDSVEQMLLMGIKERAATADMSELSRALDVVAKNNPKKSKLGGMGGSSGEGAGISVTVNLPAHVLQPLDIQTNARNEVIEVAGRPMASLTAAQIQSKLSSIES